MARRKRQILMRKIAELLESDPMQDFITSAESIDPVAIRDRYRFETRQRGRGDYIDSLLAGTQIPAVYTILVLFPDREIKILYVASSYGLGMKLIQEAGYTNIQGIDIDEKAVEFTSSQELDTMVMDASQMEFEDNTFDAVVSRDFIEFSYLGDQNRVGFLNEHYRILKPQGAAIFTTMMSFNNNEYAGLPPDEKILNSSFKNSEMRQFTLKVELPNEERTVPIRIYLK